MVSECSQEGIRVPVRRYVSPEGQHVRLVHYEHIREGMRRAGKDIFRPSPISREHAADLQRDRREGRFGKEAREMQSFFYQFVDAPSWQCEGPQKGRLENALRGFYALVWDRVPRRLQATLEGDFLPESVPVDQPGEFLARLASLVALRDGVTVMSVRKQMGLTE